MFDYQIASRHKNTQKWLILKTRWQKINLFLRILNFRFINYRKSIISPDLKSKKAHNWIRISVRHRFLSLPNKNVTFLLTNKKIRFNLCLEKNISSILDDHNLKQRFMCDSYLDQQYHHNERRRREASHMSHTQKAFF